MRLLTFAGLMAKVGCIGFGGGSALIPVIEDVFLKKEKYETKENYDKDVLVASITPGALPVELAGSLGRRNFGRKGMVTGAVMMALPGAICALFLFTMLSAFQAQLLREIKIVSVGISSFILFLLTQYIRDVVISAKKDGRIRLYKTLFVILIVFILNCGKNLYKLFDIDREPLFGISTLHILLVVLLIAFLRGITDIHSIKMVSGFDMKNLIKDLMVWFLFVIVFLLPAFIYSREVLALAGRGCVSAWMSFGGGDAYLTIADGLFVDGGMISSETYYGEIVAVVNILPGSILCKTLLGIGYYMGYSLNGSIIAGILFGAVGFAVSIAASCSSFGVVYYLYDSLSRSRMFLFVSHWIRPVIAGFLLNIMLSLCCQNKAASLYTNVSVQWILICTVGLAVLDILLGKTGRVKNIWMLVINLAVALLLLS